MRHDCRGDVKYWTATSDVLLEGQVEAPGGGPRQLAKTSKGTVNGLPSRHCA